MKLPFTNKDINTTEKAVNYAQTANADDFAAFANWFIKGSPIWTLPEGHRAAVLEAIDARYKSLGIMHG
jgi:hypothetical protein